MRKNLLTKAQFSDDGTVPLNVLLLEVVEQVSSVADHLQQAAAGMMVLFVDLHMLGQVVDPFSQKGDLHLGRTGIPFMLGILLDNSVLFFL